MSSELIFRQKITLNHKDGKRRAIFEMVVYSIPKSKDYPKGPHLHIKDTEIGYNYRGIDELMKDI
jgi:hypothetical protein